MSIVSVDREHSGETFTDAEDGSHTISYKVVCNDPAHDDGAKVCEAGQLPARNSPHPSDPTLCVKYKEARRIGPAVYRVGVHYGPIVIGGGETVGRPGGAGGIPEERDESWGVVVSQVAVDKDVHGVAITNSSGEGYDPSMMEERADLVLVIERNEPSFDEVEAVKYTRAMNVDAFRGHDAGTCRLTRTAQRMEKNGRVYFRVRNEIRIREDGWLRRVPDRGMRELKADGTGYKPIKDIEGQKVMTPVPLDGHGHAAAKGDETVWVNWELLHGLEFGKFGL